MERKFSEKALSQILEWDPEEDTDNKIRSLEVLSQKYDGYQQFEPGFRFMESLVNWLNQFSIDDAKVAYDFVKDRLIFISETQIRLLVDSAFVNYIRPFMLERIAEELGEDKHKLTKLYRSDEYKDCEKRSLFLGLSDGARTDVFRRANVNLSNEQVWMTYSVSDDKVGDFEEHLQGEDCKEGFFKYIWLMDDFSASGTSFIRRKEESNEWTGKIPKTIKMLKKFQEEHKIFNVDNIQICILLYIATSQTKKHIEQHLKEYTQETGIKEPKLIVIQHIDEAIALSEKNPKDLPILEIMDSDKYYDQRIYKSKDGKVGKTDNYKRGYAGCALPIVLEHNTPNNSISILWSHEGMDFRGLFPRVSRH